MANSLVKQFKKREQELLDRIAELEAKVKQLETKEETDDIEELASLIESNNKSTENAKIRLHQKVTEIEEQLLSQKIVTYIDDLDITIDRATAQLNEVRTHLQRVNDINSRSGIRFTSYKLVERERNLLELVATTKATKKLVEQAKYFVPRKCIMNPKHVDNPSTYTSIIEAFQNVTPKGHVYVYNSEMEQIGIIANSQWITGKKYIAEEVIYFNLGIEIYSELYDTIENSNEFKSFSMEVSLSKENYFGFQYSRLFKNLDITGEVYPFDIASFDKETAISKIKGDDEHEKNN